MSSSSTSSGDDTMTWCVHRPGYGSLAAKMRAEHSSASKAEADDDEHVGAAPAHAPCGDEGEAVTRLESYLRLCDADVHVRPEPQDFFPQRGVNRQGLAVPGKEQQFVLRHALTSQAIVPQNAPSVKCGAFHAGHFQRRAAPPGTTLAAPVKISGLRKGRKPPRLCGELEKRMRP